MGLEIERKFLVKNDSFKSESFRCSSIKQGFLNSNKNRVVRIRIIDDQGFLTIKGKSNRDGTSRKEWEFEIEKEEATELLSLCEPTIIEKKRYFVKQGSLTFEVDVFEDQNNGLIIAEIELEDENQAFTNLSWLGKEVTGDVKYYNSYLSQHPYNTWA